MRPILFLVSAASSYRLQKYVAEHLAREKTRVAFLYEHELADSIREDLRTFASDFGMTVHELVPDQGGPLTPALGRHPRPWVARILNLVSRLVQAPRLGSDLLLLRRHREALASRLTAAITLLRTLNVAAMVVSEDGISAPLPILAAARHLGVPIIDVPYGYGVRRDLELDLDNKERRGALLRPRGLCGLLIRMLAPQWLKRGPHAGALMFPSPYIVAAESLGITLRDAWIIHGGYADRVCVESEQMKRVYIEEGIPVEKLALTGSPYCDAMVRALDANPEAQAVLRQPRRIVPGMTRVLVSWPPSYHGDRAAFSEFSSYREMSLAILGWLAAQPACGVTVSLHPATLAEDRQALIDIGVQLTDRYVIELIPQHDVFVTYFSSTIRWAVAAGKPVINIDLYKLGLTVYDTAPGVLKVSTAADFKRELTRLIASEAAFANTAAQQIAVAEDWGSIDGLSTSRVAAAVCA